MLSHYILEDIVPLSKKFTLKNKIFYCFFIFALTHHTYTLFTYAIINLRCIGNLISYAKDKQKGSRELTSMLPASLTIFPNLPTTNNLP